MGLTMRALVTLLAGCNTVYGLEATVVWDATSSVADRDADGVLDDVDNCPDAANSSQDDLDRDGIGDACDTCSYVFDPTLDRDGDTVVAGADNCPTVDDVTQADADGDAIGDVCDPSPGAADTVRCFDDFSTDVSRAWNLTSVTAPWKWVGSPSAAVIFHSPATMQPFVVTAQAAGLPSTRAAVQIELGNLTTSVGAETGVFVGAADLSAGVKCTLVGTGGSPNLRVSDDRGVLAEQPIAFTGQRMLVTLTYRVGTTTQLECATSRKDGMRHAITASTDAAFSPFTVGLVAVNSSALFAGLTIYE